MNACGHIHVCFDEFVEVGRHTCYVCYNPECMTLTGAQGNCPKCSYLHGWAQALDRTVMDLWGNWA